MPSVYAPDNFAGRVNYAATVICRRGSATRHFDTCFEMSDGDAVAAALVRRAERNPKLAANLPRYLGKSAHEAAARLAGRKLAEAAREMRETAQAAHAAQLKVYAAQDAARKAVRALYSAACHGAGADARWAARDELDRLAAASPFGANATGVPPTVAMLEDAGLDLAAYFASCPISRPEA